MWKCCLSIAIVFAGCAADAVTDGNTGDAEGPATRYETDAAQQLIYARTDSSTLHFQDGSEFETGLYDLDYIGQEFGVVANGAEFYDRPALSVLVAALPAEIGAPYPDGVAALE